MKAEERIKPHNKHLTADRNQRTSHRQLAARSNFCRKCALLVESKSIVEAQHGNKRNRTRRIPNFNLRPGDQFTVQSVSVRDDEPLLFHTGMRSLFPAVRDEVARLIETSRIRSIGFSHFEADECGSLNEWLAIAPNAEPVCSLAGALVSVNDFSSRPARGMNDGDTVSTGKHNFRFVQTPHLPHCWEAGLLFEETNRTLFSSDLFHQSGDVEALTEQSIIERTRETFISYNASPLAGYMPYTRQTESNLQKLIELGPATIAAMHGSSFVGDGAQALRDLGAVMREVL